MANVTLKEIAKSLGISVTTASKALKDYPDVSAETKNAVRSLAQQLDYRPNSLALNLRNKETKTLGVVIPRIDHNFYSSVLNGIIEEARMKDYLTIILFSEDLYELEKAQIALLLEKRVDGILISPASENTSLEHLQNVLDRSIPLVTFDKTTSLLNCSQVNIDDEVAAFEGVNHLIKTGCRKIAHFRGPLHPETYNRRLQGYRRALESQGLPFETSLVYTASQLSFEDGYQLAERLFTDHQDIDAIFAMTDLVALGCLAYCKQQGIDVPNQVSILGFSNWFMGGHSEPKLSTVHQPIRELGREAVGLLLREIIQRKEKQAVAFETTSLPTKLVLRETTRPVLKT